MADVSLWSLDWPSEDQRVSCTRVWFQSSASLVLRAHWIELNKNFHFWQPLFCLGRETRLCYCIDLLTYQCEWLTFCSGKMGLSLSCYLKGCQPFSMFPCVFSYKNRTSVLEHHFFFFIEKRVKNERKERPLVGFEMVQSWFVSAVIWKAIKEPSSIGMKGENPACSWGAKKTISGCFCAPQLFLRWHFGLNMKKNKSEKNVK